MNNQITRGHALVDASACGDLSSQLCSTVSREAVAQVPAQTKACLGDGLTRILRSLKHLLACLIFGHEKWEVPCGDWACLRCGRLTRARIPLLSGDPSCPVATPESVERDRRELRKVLKLFEG